MSTKILILLLCVFFTTTVFGEEFGDCTGLFKCNITGKCISQNWRCDGEADCGEGDNSDEDCSTISKTCGTNEFRCSSGQCIVEKWKCDGDKDCFDNSDEHPSTCTDTTCKTDEFRCGNGQCISSSWRCDGTADCPDGEDETCDAPTCAEDEMRCNNGKCITKKWHCDGEDDCGDRSDEANCTKDCGEGMFACSDGNCINLEWRCDGDNDCNDHGDEQNCPSLPPNPCQSNEFSCLDNSQCILKTWICDGDEDCVDGSDEDKNVHNCTVTCEVDQFKCETGPCIDHDMKCDGIPDCADGSDELNCTETKHCPDHQFDCYGNGKKCIDYNLVCDGANDCDNWGDETHDVCNEDKCKTNNGGCDHICEPLTGSKYTCACHKGYKLMEDKHGCEDINECQNDVPVCSQICTNVKGHYKCSCVQGYKLERLYGDDEGKTTCKIEGPRPWLVFANKHDVRKVELDTWLMQPVAEELTNAVAVSYYKNKFIYWSDIGTSSSGIARTEIKNGTIGEKKDIIKTDIHSPSGIAVDWIHELLYWMDTTYNSIHAASLEGNKKTTIVSDGLDEPRGLALYPKTGYLYVTDWGSKPKIERIGMDGSNRQAIVTDAGWPNSITIDYIAERIYWIDAKHHEIKSANLDGSNVLKVIQNAVYISHPFAVAVFEDSVYWTDWDSNSIRKVHKHTGEGFEQVVLGLKSPMDLKIYHESVQKPGHSACLQNGGCEYMCLPSPKASSGDQSKHICACPDDQVLAKNKLSCIPKGQVPKTTPKPTTMHVTVVPIHKSSNGPTESPKYNATEMGVTVKPEAHKPIAFIAIGIVAFILILISVVLCFVYRRVKKRNVKSMNFDNPVYRKTTTTDDSVMIGHGHQRDSHHVKADHSEIKPLTEDV